ncbi:MAG: tetratricopeptide repeat protein [Planctomycetota bacterium]|nr:tetratricopeptide repeat protein [Planctomycetota bacterium]
MDRLVFPSFLLICLFFRLFVCESDGQDFANDIVDRARTPTQSEPQEPMAAPQANTAQQDPDQRARVVKAVLNEMNELIPGEYPADSPQQQQLMELASAFVQLDAAAVDAATKKLAELDPNLPPQGLLLAGANFTVSNAAGGRAMLERAAIEYPEHPAISLAFSRLALSQGRLSDALALVEKSVRQMKTYQLSPVAARHYQLETIDAQQIIAQRQNRLQDALALVQQWEQLAANSPKMLLARAEIEFLKGNIEPSQNYLRKFRAVVPDSRPTELVLANWFRQKGDDAGTEQWIKAAAANYPDNPVVQMELGSWSMSQGDFETAQKAIGAAEAKQGEKPATDLMKARIAFAQGDYPQAESMFAELYLQQPASFDISNMYVLSLAENEDVSKKQLAVQLAQRNLQGLPNNQIAQAALGWSLFKSGNSKDAKTLFARVTRMQRLPPEIAYYVAMILEQEGKRDQAKQLLQSALQSKGLFLYRGQAKQMLERFGTPPPAEDPGR